MTREEMLTEVIRKYGFENEWVVWFAGEVEKCESDKEVEWSMWFAENQIDLEQLLGEEDI